MEITIMGYFGICRLVMNKPSLLNKDYNRDPTIKALKKRGCINHGSTLVCPIFPCQQFGCCPPLPPLRNSWTITIIWLYIALNRTPNIALNPKP